MTHLAKDVACSGSESLADLDVFSAGFFTQAGLTRILRSAGWRVRLGNPLRRSNGSVAVWGRRPVSARGRFIARHTGQRLITVEDGFLRSVYSGDCSVPPLSLVIDDVGIYYDVSRPSRLESLLQDGSAGEICSTRAAAGIATLREERLSKYNVPAPEKDLGTGYVLIIDQTVGDASIRGARAEASTFHRMLDAARVENPGKPIVIKSHPDVIGGRKRGHFTARDGDALLADNVNPWDVIAGTDAVYTVSSQLGYEAVLAGKPVRCFGASFYAGWGLTGDEIPVPRRTARHIRESLFAVCHLHYPFYYDPWRNRLCTFEEACAILKTLIEAEQEDRNVSGEVFCGVRRWKRANLVRFRPKLKEPPRFIREPDKAKASARHAKRNAWLWASHASPSEPDGTGYVEDGFLRSVGLGAELTQAASLVFDRTGIYYDPTRPSDLEALIGKAVKGGADTERALALIRSITDLRVTKYNVGRAEAPEVPVGKEIILVPGQVEDDASLRLGAGKVATNLDLLEAARQANPDACLIYKPHPDVDAGLRAGRLSRPAVLDHADVICRDTSAADLLDRADRVWTMTSLMGFEALLRGVPVTSLGMPFYAGWGLTEDLGPTCPRRVARPTLPELVWAVLIAYPRYVDPVSCLPCTPELIVERLSAGEPFTKATRLSRLQSLFARQSWLWRCLARPPARVPSAKPRSRPVLALE